MKMNTKLALVFGTAVLAATTALAKPGPVDTVHFSIKTSLTDTGVEAGSSGNVTANEVKQHTKLTQNLVVTVSGLTPDTGYTLNAVTSDGTVDLDDFTTDDKGKATLHLRTGKGNSKNTVALPDGFELATVTELDVVGGSGTVLTTADTTPKSVQYSVKKTLTSDTASGTLEINANKNKTKFTLNASGLDATTDYNLFFNGAQVQTNTTNSKGRLKIKSAPTPENPMDLSTVEVQDTSGTTVLSATLP
jgi:hypothetical protein